MPGRHVPKGRPVHDAENRGIQALVRALPDNYTVFTNIELPSDRTGQTFEHDAVVVAPHAVFTIELKSWGGRIVGNRDRWTLADGTPVQSPIPLVLAKARVLKGRLQSRRRELGQVWVQGLVFLTAADANPNITSDYEDYVVNLEVLRHTLTDPTWLGHPTPITLSQRRAIEDFLNDGRPPRLNDQLGDFRLIQRLPAEDRPYEAWLAERSVLGRERRVLHAYTVSGDTDADRDRQRAHALREATLLGRLRGGPDILRYETYFSTQDDPQRIVLQFEDTTPLAPLDAWVKDKNPGLQVRLALSVRIAKALSWVHNQGLVHRRLSPEAVLVDNTDTSPLSPSFSLRLCAFELARDLTGAAPTITGSSLNDPTFRCTAPEVLKTAEATQRADLFSLGATLVELFTGRPLFANVDEVLRAFTIPPLHLGDRACPRFISDLVTELLAVDPSLRPQSAAEVANRLESGFLELSQTSPRVELAPGREIRQNYELLERLGRGATATSWKARQLQTDHIVVLKIADGEHARYLQEEGRALSSVHHPNLVRFHNVEPFEDGNLLVLEFVDGFTADIWAGAGDPLSPANFLEVARGLFGAIDALHTAGWLHRDIKPENVMLSDQTAVPKLLDLGLAARLDVEGDLAVGSLRYKDPLVYVENRWTQANDLFSASLVLYELLTGTHAFGGSPPEPNQRPILQPDELPEDYSPPIAESLSTVFSRLLSPTRSERPTDAKAAIRAFETALAPGPNPEPAPPPPEPKLTLETLELESPLARLDLSTRAHGALARLGLSLVSDLVGYDPERARGLANVGSKTLRELRQLQALIDQRWPTDRKAPAVPVERFYPALAEDPRTLDVLGRDLTPAIRGALEELEVHTIGALSAMPPRVLEHLPAVGPHKLSRLRVALRRLAGRERLPESLAELGELLREELGDRIWEAISLVFGLTDGRARTHIEVAQALSVSRQRVSQAMDLAPLRAEASWGHHLVALMSEAIPRPGFASLEVAATALAARLTPGETSSPIGFARLAALLMRPEGRSTEASDLSLVLRPPWTAQDSSSLIARLSKLAATWPPIPRQLAEVRLWDSLPDMLQRTLVRWGADAPMLLDALLKLDLDVALDRVGGLYTPPVELSSALAVLRPSLVPVIDTSGQLITEAHAAYRGVVEPTNPDEVDQAIERAGFRRDPEAHRWVDPARVELALRPVSPRVDPSIPTQQVVRAHEPPIIAALASQVARGGFRVVALSPAKHHRLAHRLSDWLRDRLGQDVVELVSIDRLLIDTLKAHDLWKFVPYLETNPQADYRMFHAELAAALDQAVTTARPGRVTVLGQPTLLGPLGLMDWLSGFYERARGGRHGLVVLAVPGGIHEDRVRLNEKFNLPYTPDMAAVYLEAS